MRQLGAIILQTLLGRRRQRRIFISYRRHGDGAGYGGRLSDSLIEHFGSDQCFLDVEHIPAGVDFVQCLEEGVSACEVLIVVIGPDWLTQTDAAGKTRLEDPKDFVRIEVAAALKRNVRVIPVLVGGAQIPSEDLLPDDLKALSRRQAHELSDSRWAYDTRTLLQAIERVGIRGRVSAEQAALQQRIKAVAAAGAAGVLVLATVLVAGNLRGSLGVKDPQPPPPGNPQVEQGLRDALAEKDRVGQLLAKAVREREDSERAAEQAQRDRIAVERRLTQADKDRQVALQTVARAQRERGSAEQQANELRRQKEVLEASLAKVPPATPKAPAEIQSVPVVSACGSAQVFWRHQGVRHDASLLMKGPHGLATVSYLGRFGNPVTVEQDIHVVPYSSPLTYAGSNPRIAGTNIPDPDYLPDAFRLERLSNGGWKVRDVGYPGHFDPAEPGPRSVATSLGDCR